VRWGSGPDLTGTHPPIFVRELSGAERAQLEASRRSKSAFTMRRAQIVLSSASRQPPRAIAAGLGCARQTVRNAIRAFNAAGLAALTEGSSRPKSAARVLDGSKLERLRAILLSDETIRQALLRLGVGWKRAKRWLTSPDPDHAREKVAATA
jgi:transposase